MPSEVFLEINGQAWEYWSNVTLVEQVDGIARVSFTSVFEPERKEFREVFRPYSYPEIVMHLGGEVRFVGTGMAITPQVSPDQVTVTVDAYAKCGVLNDVTMLESQLPTEFKNLTLEQIAKQVCEPFGVNVVFGQPQVVVLDLDSGGSYLDIDALGRTDPGTPFEKVQLKPGKKILPFLIDLAKQRGLIIRSTPDGDLLFTVANTDTNDVIATLEENRPVVKVTPNFETQEYYSSLTGIAKTKGGATGSRFSVENPKLADNFDVNRPYVYELNDTDPADVPVAVEARMGRMFADAISYDIDVATTEDQSTTYWTPDRYITLLAPKAMVYRKSPLLIRENELRFTPTRSDATLRTILPGALSGELPELFPWEE